MGACVITGTHDYYYWTGCLDPPGLLHSFSAQYFTCMNFTTEAACKSWAEDMFNYDNRNWYGAGDLVTGVGNFAEDGGCCCFGENYLYLFFIDYDTWCHPPTVRDYHVFGGYWNDGSVQPDFCSVYVTTHDEADASFELEYYRVIDCHERREGCCGCTWCCDMPRAECVDIGGHPLGQGNTCTDAAIKTWCHNNPGTPLCITASYDVECSRYKPPGTEQALRLLRWRIVSRGSQNPTDYSPLAGEECMLHQGIITQLLTPSGKQRSMGITCAVFDRTRPPSTPTSKRYYVGAVEREAPNDPHFHFRVNYREACAEKPDPCDE